ncbi:molybdate ABC transporter permease subunit [Halobacteriaceae archaeon GCM10025711]
MFPTHSETDHGTRRRTDWRTVTVVLGSLLLVYYLVPMAALVVAQSPLALARHATSPYVLTAASNSLVSSAASTLIAAAFGLPLAYWLARTDVRGKTLVTTVVILPLVLPPIVSGMLLVKVFGPMSLGGVVADATGVSLTRSLVGVVLAQTFVASPFLVVTAKAAFEEVDPQLEHASRSLGRDRWTTLRKVTLPLAKPGIVAGLTLTFARAMGEFGATIMMAYYPRTMPVEIWVSWQSRGLDAALPVALVLVGIAVATLLVIHLLGANPWGATDA